MNNLIRVIAIDDNQLIITQLELLLQQVARDVDYHGFTAGRHALDSGLCDSASLIFLDLNMPEIDGIELLRIFADAKLTTPIVLLSGEDKDVLETASNLGTMHNLNIISNIDKPVSLPRLKALLECLDQHHRASPILPDKHYNASDIRIGLDRQQFKAHYQPKVSLESLSVIGMEILARWYHPFDGIISPGEFIPQLERAGHSAELSLQLLTQTLVLYNKHYERVKSLNFSLNLSAGALYDIELPNKLATLCDQHSVPRKQIILEITESQLLDNLPRTLEVLLRFRLKGFALSIDDFGTGFSSFTQLNQVPFSELKIDRSFVQNCDTDSKKQAIVSATSDLAKKLSLKTVAEGIEHAGELNYLRMCGIDVAQGFLFAKPLATDALLNWLEHHLNKPLAEWGT
ncbi:EAL domain-containing response regulator [Pseudoalteromonas sp. OOF1S-7]|uniref:EAL domain-containing response regulator n=1 Tax=Pseudoalteromonas sp. OOF1S-7 TaxID=2917757 RepID=UPI001EF70C52|nr:EAL domain-containing response regulator [Pseudoalteromonas sp. OOF1S-7]MCG7534299.1 EAL domain-containing response regulator [Pseudoalteromonas sp. OOF1S-7]